MIRLMLGALLCCLMLGFCAGAAFAQEPANPHAVLAPSAPITVTNVAPGYAHVCAALADPARTVQCWGGNWSGQLGTASNLDTPLPVDAPMSHTVGLAAGVSFTCAIKDGGEVWCWGRTQQGDDGGFTALDGAPTRIELPAATSIDAGLVHVCALEEDQVWCWGRGDDGQLGRGVILWPLIHPEAEPVIGLSGAVEVGAGGYTSCARRADGRVLCWGGNKYGQLGAGALGGYSTTPVLVSDVISATSLAVGMTAACAVMPVQDGEQSADSHVRCWGQLGVAGDFPFSSTVALPISGTVGALDVAVADNTACARMDTGRVRCWGANSRGGRLGVGHARPMTATVEVVGLDDVVALEADGHQICAIRGNGQLLCWGDNYYGGLGLGYTLHGSPTEVPRVSGVEEIDAGYNAACARQGGTVLCWGENSARSAAAPWEHQPASPTALPAGATSLTFDLQTGCAVVAAEVWCWGLNDYGQVGIPPTVEPPVPPPMGPAGAAPSAEAGAGGITDAPQPEPLPTYVYTATRVSGLPAAVEVVTGGFHTCARTIAGEVWCWGSVFYNALGDGSTNYRPTPGRVPGIYGATALASDGYGTCAVVEGRELWCWGSAADSTAPKRVLTLEGITQLEMGWRATCVRAQGQWRCWGFDGSSGFARPWYNGLPPLLPDGADASDVSLYWDILCVVRAGEVWCAGTNDHGRVAEEAPHEVRNLWRVANVEGAVGVSPGWPATCAIVADGRVLCWGDARGGTRGINPGWLAAPVQGLGAPTIEGKVLDKWGFPVRFAQVTADSRRVRVDEQGNFALPGLPAGLHSVRAVERFYAFAPVSHSVQTPGAPFLLFTGSPSPEYRTHLPLLQRAP